MKTRVDLELGGEVYQLLPGPKALMRISKEVGDPVQMCVALSAGADLGRTPPLKTVVEVLHIALAESDHKISEPDLWDLIHETGVDVVFEPFAEFLGALCNKGVVPEVEGEDSEAAPPENRRTRRAKKAKARPRKAKK